jgi:hypothetical protein
VRPLERGHFASASLSPVSPRVAAIESFLDDGEIGQRELEPVTSRSRTGSTAPAGCKTSSSSNARTTWTIASVSRMLARNWLPSPSPCEALYQTGDVGAPTAGTTRWANDPRDNVESWVGHVDPSDVRVLGGERMAFAARTPADVTR